MPKIKIKNWKGIYTNIDENDNSFEYAKASVNFKHSRGVLTFEDRNLSEYELPEIDSSLSSYNWEWETGIYCTLLNDPFKELPTAKKYNCLVVIAKAEDSGTYHRLIYLKNLTDDSIWYELSKQGNADGLDIFIPNHNGSGSFEGSYFSTTIDGEAFFRVEDGKLKIFLPHDAFWVGRLERQLHYKASPLGYLDPNQWYIDRLVEPFDSDNLTIISENFIPPTITTGNPITELGALRFLDTSILVG